MANLATQVQELANIGDQKTKIERYKAALHEYVNGRCISQLIAFIDHLLAEDVPLVVSRQVLQELAGLMQSAVASDSGAATLQVDELKEVGLYTLERSQQRAVSFEEQISSIRESLSIVYERAENWSEAAKMLAGIPLDSGIRVLDDNYKVEKYIQIAMYYLQDEENVSAETFINRASLLLGEETTDELKLKHKVCYARILDAKRKFLEAATSFYQLSQMQTRHFEGGKEVSEEELTVALKLATTAAILAPAGPQRSRLLKTLYKDERSARMPNYKVLEKMFMDRLLRAEEVEDFAATLATHQKAIGEDGTTVLDRAVMEHNMLAVSKLYKNISFEQLGALLGIDAAQAERVAAAMLVEERLEGSIDQVDQMLHFQRKNVSAALYAFDVQIEHICHSVESVTNAIAHKHPEFALALQ
mmetsp:Transcript_1264/g.2648  ORF Transcript_1264/g.2648 Transcript_1264/m.2648 type:complete len:417 (-) Transcript_1264:160-1410(-)